MNRWLGFSRSFSRSHGRPRVDDHRVLSGIIFINRNGLRWRDAPREYGPAKTLYNRWKRWSDKGVFVAMMDGLSAKGTERKTIMIDATYLKAHRTASSLVRSQVASRDWQFGKVTASHFTAATPTRQKFMLEAIYADWQRHGSWLTTFESFLGDLNESRSLLNSVCMRKFGTIR
jgi:transposase